MASYNDFLSFIRDDEKTFSLLDMIPHDLGYGIPFTATKQKRNVAEDNVATEERLLGIRKIK